jgi:hypothetical protein
MYLFAFRGENLEDLSCCVIGASCEYLTVDIGGSLWERVEFCWNESLSLRVVESSDWCRR